MDRLKAVFNWSGGKDSALALYRILQEERFEVVALLTTVSAENGESTMHAIPEGLLRRQAERIGIPLHVVRVGAGSGAEGYDAAMERAVEHFRRGGVTHFVFGDIFLEDVRRYRESRLERCGIEVVEPLWGVASHEAVEEFLKRGFRTVVVTVEERLGRERVGRVIDDRFVWELPEGVDCCGENGEYHTFCFDGPIFSEPVPFTLGETLYRSFEVKLDNGDVRRYGYWFAGLGE